MGPHWNHSRDVDVSTWLRQQQLPGLLIRSSTTVRSLRSQESHVGRGPFFLQTAIRNPQINADDVD